MELELLEVTTLVLPGGVQCLLKFPLWVKRDTPLSGLWTPQSVQLGLVSVHSVLDIHPKGRHRINESLKRNSSHSIVVCTRRLRLVF
jgi:hypothetical protein